MSTTDADWQKLKERVENKRSEFNAYQDLADVETVESNIAKPVVLRNGRHTCAHIPNPECSEPEPHCGTDSDDSEWIYREKRKLWDYSWCKKCRRNYSADDQS